MTTEEPMLRPAPDRIWLEPDCATDERCWCEHDNGPCDDCGLPWVEYVRVSRTPPVDQDEVALKLREARQLLVNLATASTGSDEFSLPRYAFNGIVRALDRAREALELIAAPREIVINVDTGESRPETDKEAADFARRHARAALSTDTGSGW